MFPGMEHLGCMWLATGGSQNGGRPGDDVSTVTPHDHAYPQPGHTTTADGLCPTSDTQIQPRGLCYLLAEPNPGYLDTVLGGGSLAE